MPSRKRLLTKRKHVTTNKRVSTKKSGRKPLLSTKKKSRKRVSGGGEEDTNNTNTDTLTLLTFNQGKAWKQGDAMTAKQKKKISDFADNNIVNSDLFVLAIQEGSDSDDLVKAIDAKLKEYSLIHDQNAQQISLGRIGIYVWAKIKKGEVDFNVITSGSKVCGNSLKVQAEIFLRSVTKGGLYVVIQSKKTGAYFSFANCHLPSDAENINDRNQCLKSVHEEIIETVKTQTVINKVKQPPLIANPVNSYLNMFFLGDLNYRTNTSTPSKIEAKRISKEECSTIKYNYEDDQLQNEMKTDKNEMKTDKNGLKWMQLIEPNKSFCQTCRFQEANIGENDSDRRYDGKRFPSWCDRILFRAAQNSKIDYNSDENSSYKYDSITLSNLSDHDAVYGTFSISTPKINQKRFKK